MDALSIWLSNNKMPSRKVKELDNRGSSFYVAFYWAQELAKKNDKFKQLAESLVKNEKVITEELIEC